MIKEYNMPNNSEKPILVTKWITETNVYPSGKVIQKVYPLKETAKSFSSRKKKKETQTYTSSGDAEVETR